ncbi:TonB-dependent receptor [Spirosoma montaniterrae]|uniref:TonB-dependent receptor n=1 Tax=Spirosoma montaniterrae TaxID=1178516 RepID=A0A1P9WXS1_9BACT|nr:TonB-dependent receptor [Spirosoma montaniterrae]AQG80196.1 TonB-dependent receptor [Spirosoma montaniterrae]
MRLLPLFLMLVGCVFSYAQTSRNGCVYDAESNEPIAGATVQVPGTTAGAITNRAGRFSLTTDARQLRISTVGYRERLVTAPATGEWRIALEPAVEDLQAIVVTASREAQKRTEAPVAIAKLNTTLVQETRPQNLVELLNKVPGVAMPNLQNEQHSMSIRQPLSTNAYFLYMEDGVPLRPMGLFNHNSLIETNLLAISSIEVVRGPASSLYGPEAVGGAINLITFQPTAIPTVRVGIQGDQWSFRRVQYNAGGMLTKKLGVFVGGSFARQRDTWLPHMDYDKTSVNARLDYHLTNRTTLTASVAYNNYRSQVNGGIDSVAYYNRQYVVFNDFMDRNIRSMRARLTLNHQWARGSESFVTLFYRDNYYPQSPTHTVRWTTGQRTAWTENQITTFSSRGLLAQHSQRFDGLRSKLIVGGSADYSPVSYNAYRYNLAADLRADGRSVERYRLLEERPDLKVSNYAANLFNTALYAQLDVRPLDRLQLTAGGRFDRMAFDYQNFIDKTTGTKTYQQFTPKLGLTYDLGQGVGVYANYSRGFAPPGLSAIFRPRPNPKPGQDLFYYNLKPAQFSNREVGGWASLLKNRLYIDLAYYHMDARDEILSIRQPDGNTDFQSAGQTLHRGVEWSLSYRPTDAWLIRFSGTRAIHRFVDFTLSTRATDAVQKLDGFDMPSSPNWLGNTEVIYKPGWAKGLRLSAEWQRIGWWYVDQVNRYRYDDRGFLGGRGVSLLNLRAGYVWRGAEVFVNVLNATNELYANSASRGNNATDRTQYNPGQPRTAMLGLMYTFTGRKRE